MNPPPLKNVYERNEERRGRRLAGYARAGRLRRLAWRVACALGLHGVTEPKAGAIYVVVCQRPGCEREVYVGP